MLWLAGTQLSAQTRGARRVESYRRCREGHVKERETPRAGDRASVRGDGELCSGSDVQQMTFRTSTVEHRFRRCAKLLDLESFIHQGHCTPNTPPVRRAHLATDCP